MVDGSQRERFGACAAEIVVSGVHQIDLQWLGADGKPRKSEPAKVRRQFAEEFKALKQRLDDLRKTLPAQSARIERLPMGERSWPHPIWKERYLDHPLLSLLSRRLVWCFDQANRITLGAWRDGAIVDVAGRALAGLGGATRVRLWHPIEADTATVGAWQDWLERHRVTQPFKQAHREVYVLTDAERRTETYSNRFAGHILRQHQFHKLCQQRGWSYRLQGWFDDDDIPTIELPRRGLSVEYLVEPIVDGDESMSPSGVSLLVSKDQYLCILPSRGGAVLDPGQHIFLPFEGDRQLAVILSKALLLANDTAITDPTITRQIRR